jgi:hypothetical protein
VSASPDVRPPGDRHRDAVTVAVLCRADEPALARTLHTLEAAADRLARDGHEVGFAICVNGPAGSGSALAAANAMAARHAPGAARVLVDARADKARAWNLVRATCTTPLIAFCDADVEVAPDALARLAATLEAAPAVQLASARQVPVFGPFASEGGAAVTRRATLVARAAAIPYRFDFQVVGGRLYLMRAAAVERMPEGLLLEDGWLSARLGNDALRTVHDAEVRFHPPTTLADYFRERMRTEAGKLQIRDERRDEGRPQQPIARYRWREMAAALGAADLPLVAVNLGVRAVARTLAGLAARRGRSVAWAQVASSKPHPTEVP